jgi:3-hydroxybutyryl-CoA dehydrogenase
MKSIGKVPVRVNKEIRGWLFNRIQDAIRREAYSLWADGVASADDIDIGIRATIGFRMPHEGPMRHYDLTGMWRWPKDVRIKQIETQFKEKPQLTAEVVEKIKQRMAEGKPWFIDPEKFEEVNEDRDREYARCLKQWYWTKT